MFDFLRMIFGYSQSIIEVSGRIYSLPLRYRFFPFGFPEFLFRLSNRHLINHCLITNHQKQCLKDFYGSNMTASAQSVVNQS